MDSGSAESAWSEAGGGVLDDVRAALRSSLCGLTTAEQQAGHTFVKLWPSAYIVAHLDYVRSVRIELLGPERTRLVAEWHFAEALLCKSADGRTAPSPGQTYPMTFVTGMPSAVKPFNTATRTWNSAT